LRELAAMPAARLAAMSDAARELVERRFAWPAIADELRAGLPATA
jgi:hypothetical protein